jgi:hypothetical protein
VILSRTRVGDDRPAARDSETRRLGFDDLVGSDTLYEIPSGYGGLDWTCWVATHQKCYVCDGFVNANTSGEFIAYNSSGQRATVASARPFDFVGTNLGQGWLEGEGGDVIVRAWRGGELAYEDRLRVSVSGPTVFEADYRGIDRLEMVHERYWQVALDDFRYRLDE